MPVGAVIGAGVLGAGATVYSANSAANSQKNAANTASATEQNALTQVQQTEAPYIDAGKGALTQLQSLTGTNAGGNPLTAALTTPFASTPEQLAQTPGYQFSLDQGEKAAQNSYASQGLGSSGAAEKGAVNYAEGLAGTTFQQQFQNYLTQNSQIAGILQNQVNSGASAAGTVANAAQGTGTNIASNQIGAGNAAAAASNASGAAVSSGASNAASAYYQNNLLQQLLAQQNANTAPTAASSSVWGY